nr:formate dehydrogenase accessory protein FdhE [Halomonas sp.]
MKHTYGNSPSGVMAPPDVVLPTPDHFAIRALRLQELSQRVEPLGEFLTFMAQLASAQQVALEHADPAWAPIDEAFVPALEHGMPPLNVRALRQDIDLHTELAVMLDALELHVGEAQRTLLIRLRELPRDEVDLMADDVLAASPGDPERRGMMPLVAAAMQVAWLRLTQSLPRAPDRPSAEARALCPCCGSPPVASVIEATPERSGVRYLQCGLCATQWYFERSICSVCEQSGKLGYLSLENETGEPALPAQAETCGDCGTYLKVISHGVDPQGEPLADDLASLALDLLLAEEEQYQRSGFNPLLVVGG